MTLVVRLRTIGLLRKLPTQAGGCCSGTGFAALPLLGPFEGAGPVSPVQRGQLSPGPSASLWGDEKAPGPI